MRKRLITPIPQDVPPLDVGWLELNDAAVVEVTSEEKEHPVESHWSQEKCEVGVPPILALKPSG
jgi:hypothetical protein